MGNLSIFISKGSEIIDEIHDINALVAYKIAMDTLYKNGVLVPNVSVVVRDGKQIFFSATNP